MTSTEKDRLDLRQEFERLFNDKRIAQIAMEAMPPIDYSKLATKQDLAALDAKLTGDMSQLRGEFAELRGEMVEMKGELKLDIAKNLRTMLAAQLTTMMMLGTWLTAIN